MAFKPSPVSRRKTTKRSGKHSNQVWRIGQLRINKTLRVPIIIFVLTLVYGAISFVVNNYNPIKTTPAVQVSMDDAFSTTGYFIRDERVIDIAEGDTVEYNYSDGEKVQIGASLITEYEDEDALSVSRELRNIEDNITQLEMLQEIASISTNSNQINQKIVSQMNAISNEAEQATVGQTASLAAELRQLALKGSSLQTDVEDIETEVSALQEQADELRERLAGKTKEITSPYGGYFCESIDGYESVLTTDVVDNLTLRGLDHLLDEQGETSAGKGKIVTGYTWYFAATVDNEDAARLKQGGSVKLRFSQVNHDVRVTVDAIRGDSDSEKTLVVFKALDMDEALVAMRKQVATVVIGSYSGLRVPKSAVRMQTVREDEDPEMGVYVLSNAVSSYKKIEVQYEGTDYYIVKQNVTGNDSLVAGDDIIVEAKDLDNKKVVK